MQDAPFDLEDVLERIDSEMTGIRNAIRDVAKVQEAQLQQQKHLNELLGRLILEIRQNKVSFSLR